MLYFLSGTKKQHIQWRNQISWNEEYIFQMRKYRSPIGKVVSCTKFLLIPTGVKSNKIIGIEEENRMNQAFTYSSRKLGTRQKLLSGFFPLRAMRPLIRVFLLFSYDVKA